ncbi:hypothetical protein [Nonomuraea sp. NPDC049400]|uniref:hypothetical protein n=1 Tax=Nonomuraea sp. NPDC049400 TaxID=3364352 RepID=UPI0037AE5E50
MPSDDDDLQAPVRKVRHSLDLLGHSMEQFLRAVSAGNRITAAYYLESLRRDVARGALSLADMHTTPTPAIPCAVLQLPRPSGVASTEVVYEFDLVTGVASCNSDGHRVIFRVARSRFEGNQAMAADNSVTPEQWLAKQIETGDPDRPFSPGCAPSRQVALR